MKRIKVWSFIVTLFSLIFVFVNMSLAVEAVADYKEILQHMPGYEVAQKQYDMAVAQARSTLETQIKIAKSDAERKQLMMQYADFCKEQRNVAFDPLIGKMKYVLQQIAQERHYSKVSANNIGVTGVDITQIAIQRLNVGQTGVAVSQITKLDSLKTDSVPTTGKIGTENTILKPDTPVTITENTAINVNSTEKTYAPILPLTPEEKLIVAQREINVLRARIAELEKEKREGKFSETSLEANIKTVSLDNRTKKQVTNTGEKRHNKESIPEIQGAVEVQFGAGYDRKIIQSDVDRATRLGIADCYVADAKDKRNRTFWRARASVSNYNEAILLCKRLTKLGFKNFIVQ